MCEGVSEKSEFRLSIGTMRAPASGVTSGANSHAERRGQHAL